MKRSSSTSTVISSSNENSDFFAIKKITKHKKHIGKLYENYRTFRSHRQKVSGKNEMKNKKKTFQEIRLYSITLQLFAILLSHSSNTVGHN